MQSYYLFLIASSRIFAIFFAFTAVLVTVSNYQTETGGGLSGILTGVGGVFVGFLIFYILGRVERRFFRKTEW